MTMIIGVRRCAAIWLPAAPASAPALYGFDGLPRPPEITPVNGSAGSPRVPYPGGRYPYPAALIPESWPYSRTVCSWPPASFGRSGTATAEAASTVTGASAWLLAAFSLVPACPATIAPPPDWSPNRSDHDE